MTSARVPDFLIVGAMKAGTTTLYRDLHGHPQLYLPEEKEPDTLTCFGDDDAAMRNDYAKLFRAARPGNKLGEASTSYTKRPQFEGVAGRARRICGRDLKILYIERDPVERALSQYRHEYGNGYYDTPLAEAIETDERFVDFGAYDWQMAPWLEEFGADNVLRIDFAAYMHDRHATLDRVAAFLGVDEDLMPSPDTNRAFNSSEGKRVARGSLRRLVLSDTYQKVVKPLIPWSLRERAGRLLMSRARRTKETLCPAQATLLLERIARRNASAYTQNEGASRVVR